MKVKPETSCIISANQRRTTFHEFIRRFKPHFRTLFLFLLAFLAGCLFTGFLIFGQRSFAIGKLDQRYDNYHARAAEIIGELERELGRERDTNRQLRENNLRAREFTQRVTLAAERNVRNLQDAVILIGELRKNLKILADFYDNSHSGNGAY